MATVTADVAELYRKHGHVVLRRARRLLGNDADAYDVLQDVFLAIHRSGERFAGRSSIVTYLYSMTTHACLNRIREQRTRVRLHDATVERWTSGTGGSMHGDSYTLARQVLAALDDDEATLAIYLYCDDLTHAEIASLLGCSRRQVGNLVQRLAMRIREIEPERGCA